MKNIDYIISKTSNDLKIPKDKVKPLVDEYWSTLERKVSKMESTTIFIRDVGVITISKFKLRGYIIELLYKIRRAVRYGKTHTMENKVMVRYYNRLRKSLAQRNIIAIHFKNKKWASKKQSQNT